MGSSGGRRAAIVLMLAVAGLVAAETRASAYAARARGVVEVSGAVVTTIELRLPGGEGGGEALRVGGRDVRFGANLTPDGAPSDSPDRVTVAVDPAEPSFGACYGWAGAVTVRSNRRYAVTVTASAGAPRLTFLTSPPAGFAACAAGEPVGPGMFDGRQPAGAWVTGQRPTAGRSHPYWLGLEVRWTDPAGPIVTGSRLTFSAVPAL